MCGIKYYIRIGAIVVIVIAALLACVAFWPETGTDCWKSLAFDLDQNHIEMIEWVDDHGQSHPPDHETQVPVPSELPERKHMRIRTRAPASS